MTIGVYSPTVFKLLSTSGDQSIELAPGRTLVVGRAVTSDVPIYDPTISRRHAEITLVAGGVRVKDLGSSNGTFLNGARITQADAGANDVVTFGKVAFTVAGYHAARPGPPRPRPRRARPAARAPCRRDDRAPAARQPVLGRGQGDRPRDRAAAAAAPPTSR